MSDPVQRKRAGGLTRRNLLAGAACLAASSQLGAAPTAAPRPNFVVILFDDLGYSDLGPYGSEIPTPNIDALARGGLSFAQFYNAARCSPSRAALLTGLYPHQAGMGYLPGMRLPRGTFGELADRAVTTAQLLDEAGYFTAMTGKWHLGDKPGSTAATRGFSRSLNAVAGGIYYPDQIPPPGKPTAPRHLLLDGAKIALDDSRLGKDWYGTQLWTDWGIRFIDEARAANQPFYLYLSHIAPHFPVMAPAEEVNRFRGKYREGWDVLRANRFARQQRLGLFKNGTHLSPPIPSQTDWSALADEERDRFDAMMAVYAAAVARLDRSVGDLVAHLKRTGQFDNTVIMVLSDNGGNAESGPRGKTGDRPWGGPGSNVVVGMNWAQLQNTPFRMFKHFTHEGGIASPLIVSWPAALVPRHRGGIEQCPSHLIDLAPTILELAGVSYPASYKGKRLVPLPGRSLAPLLGGRPLVRGEPLFWEHEGNRAVRAGRWKAVRRLGHDWELYDLDRDRTEITDLAAREPARIRALANAWDRWAEASFVDAWPELAPRKDWGAIAGQDNAD